MTSTLAEGAEGQSVRRSRRKKQLNHTNRYKGPRPPGLDQQRDDQTLTSLRQKVRQVSRMLEHDDKISKSAREGKRMDSRPLPAHIRQEKERALAGYRFDLEKAEEQALKNKQHRKMISRYHYVRFVERQKAERNLKKARKALEAGNGSEEDVLVAQSDLNYALYLPLDDKYVSIWPANQEDPHGVRSSESWKKIQDLYLAAQAEGLDDNAVEARMMKIRDKGWLNTAGSRCKSPETRQAPRVAISGFNPKVSTGSNGLDQENVDMDGDSDGFFE